MDFALKAWLLVSGVAAIPTAFIVALGRKRVDWRSWELAAFLMPFWAWIAIDQMLHRPKSLSNLGELAAPILLIPLAALIRTILARRFPQEPTALVLQVALVAAMLVQYFATPLLPE